MTTYVDGFIITIPRKNIESYKKMATLGAKTWMKHGALDYKECIMEDATPEGIERTFPKLASATKEETIIFAYITFKSKAHRDEVNAKVMADPDMQPEKFDEGDMPFEMTRMTYGGFEVLVDGMNR